MSTSQENIDRMLAEILGRRIGDPSQPGTLTPPTNPSGQPQPPDTTQMLPPGLQPRAPAVPNVGPPATHPTVSPDPDTRMSGWRDLLTNFTFSLASGLTARARNPRAGIGEALMAPFELQERHRKERLQEQQIKYQQAQEDRARAASEALMSQINERQTKLPAELQAILARTGAAQAQTAATTQATTQGAQLFPTKLEGAEADLKLKAADLAQKSFIKLGNSIFSVKDLMDGGADVQPLVNGDVMFTVTPELAAGVGNPELAGKQVKAQVGAQLTSMLSSATKTSTTGEGVISRNLITGDKTRIGSPVAEARPVQVIGDTGLPQYMTAGRAMATGATPGTLSDVNRLTGQAASFTNFHSNAARVKELLPAIGKPGATSRIAAAMGQPTSTLGQYLQGQVATGNLTADEYDLINALNIFREDSFNLRQFFGNSPMRSDKQVNIMMSQIPDVRDLTTGDPATVARKIDAFERSVHSVEAVFGPLMSILKAGGRSGRGQAGPGTPPPPNAPPPSGPDIEIGADGRVVIRNNKQPGGRKP